MSILKLKRPLSRHILSASCLAVLALGTHAAFAQVPSLPGEGPLTPPAPPTSQGAALPTGPNEGFDFDDGDLGFEASPEEQKAQAREEAFDAALQGLLPLQPGEIRTLLERFDRTQESVQTPVYPAPKPEIVVQNVSLDPGVKPAVIKLAYGHVTTVNFLDSTGSPWPVQDISWAGNFEVIQAEQDPEKFHHMFRISPQSEFAYGNMSITLTSLKTPVIVTLETNRDVVHYRFDAVVPDYGPLAKAPLIETGVMTTAGSEEISGVLSGVMPQNAERMDVSGVDGRTSAYRYNGQVYVRTPLTLLSPGWSSSSSSADGMHVYEIEETPVLLLSDRGRMVRAKLTGRANLLEDMIDE